MKMLFILTFLFSVEMALAADNGIQVKPLENFPGAAADLRTKLQCLRLNFYPKDIENCGLAGFDDKVLQKKIEKCFVSRNGSVVPLQFTPDGHKRKIILVVQCSEMTVSAVFEKKDGRFLLVEVGQLID